MIHSSYPVGVVEFRDLLLVHDQQVGLVVVALGGRRIAVLHLLALPLGTGVVSRRW